MAGADFPLNDGGLFYAMTEELRRAGYRLPAVTDYNGIGIPYGYSPLAFYVAALLADVTPLGLLAIFRLLPAVVACLLVVAFASLARDSVRSRAALVGSVFAFALAPRSFIWMIMGGGLTRSFGFLFALLAIRETHRFHVRRAWRHAALAAGFAALTVLSHLGTAPFLALSIVLFFLAHGRHRTGLLGSAAIALATAALTAPWWGTVLATHGLAPFLAANASGASIFTDSETRRWILIGLARFELGSTSEALFPVIGVLAVLGGLVVLGRGGWLLPAWWVAIVVLDARQGTSFSTVPIALLAGTGVAEVLLPLLARRPVGSGLDAGSSRALGPTAVAALVALVGYASMSALAKSPYLTREGSYLVSLRPGDRQAMGWVAARTPADSRFLLVTGSQWWNDRVSEWFPVLARRHSVATVQGSEWVPGGFERQKVLHARAQRCAHWAADAHCLDHWARETGGTFSHVYVAYARDNPCCRYLLPSLDADPRYRRIYSNDRAVVYARLR